MTRPPILLRDPIWGTIRLDPLTLQIVDTTLFQRLRYVKQLGLAYLVYPGATHTRFDHALGVYHLTLRALAVLREEKALETLPPEEPQLVTLAALLHDIGHYPFSHALEELEEGWIPGHHEVIGGGLLATQELSAVLQHVAPDAVARVEALIRGRSESPLQGLVSGSLDLDKIEYLNRDARFCGVPVGEVDVDRLLHALTLVEDPETGRVEVGVHEKGVAALESLLFAKYQMFRNVYWHHAVRAATVLYKRVVGDALAGGLLEAAELVGKTDESLLFLLGDRARRRSAPAAVRIADWVDGLRLRRLPKRAAEVVAAELEGDSVGDWLATDSPLKRQVEDRLAVELEVPEGAVFLDYPVKTAMFDLDLLVRRRSGEVLRLGPKGRAGLIGLPRLAEDLYQTARVLRLFTLGARRRVAVGPLLGLVTQSTAEVRERLDSGQPLLA